MREEACAIPTTTKLETPEGPLTIATIARSPVSVMTRTDDGEIRFAMTREARKIEAAQPVLRITLAGGRAFRVGSGQILLKKGMEEIRARDLQPGDQLEILYEGVGLPRELFKLMPPGGFEVVSEQALENKALFRLVLKKQQPPETEYVTQQ